MPLQPLREAVRRAVERSSVLSTASAIGMSAPGLRNFLDGGTPRRSTFRKLSEWYVREAANAGDVSDETIEAALALMLGAVPEESRAEATQIVVEALLSVHRQYRIPVPVWLDKLQAG